MPKKLLINGKERREIHLYPYIVAALTRKAKKKNLKVKNYIEELAITDAKNNGQ